MNSIVSFFKFCLEALVNPERVSGFVNGWSLPVSFLVLSGMTFFWPLGFFMGAYSISHGLVLLFLLTILGIPLMAIFWAYSSIMVYSLSRIFGRGLEWTGAFKLVGICLSVLFVGGLVNALVGLMFYRSPLAPNFIVMVLTLIYFVYCITKALKAGLKDGAYVVGLLYTIISLFLWLAVKP